MNSIHRHAYSQDVREKVMEAIELNGLKKSEASELFNIAILNQL